MVSGRPLSRCLSKMQLFQPSFEICPFETELNMDIAAALKVCPSPLWQPAPLAPGSACSATLCCPFRLPHSPHCLGDLSCREATVSGMTGS